jgi:group I intron endonuclease
MENYYVYVYQDVTKPCKIHIEELGICFLYEPFYIGKGKGERYKSHLLQYKLNIKSHLSSKIKRLKSIGFEPHIEKIFQELTESQSFDFEKKLILKLGKRKDKTGPLVNITDGGEGVSGLKHSEESRKIMSYKTSGERHPWFGKKMPQETRNKISERMKVNNPMHRKDISEAVRLKNLGREPWNKGQKTPEEVREKQSKKKLKYFDIELTHKVTGKKFNFNNVFEVMDFLQRSHRSILNYLIKNESQEYYITYNKINN